MGVGFIWFTLEEPPWEIKSTPSERILVYKKGQSPSGTRGSQTITQYKCFHDIFSWNVLSVTEINPALVCNIHRRQAWVNAAIYYVAENTVMNPGRITRPPLVRASVAHSRRGWVQFTVWTSRHQHNISSSEAECLFFSIHIKVIVWSCFCHFLFALEE